MSTSTIVTLSATDSAAFWLRGTQMTFVALYAVSLWDWLTNFGREWPLIHKGPDSASKYLYLLCRYWTIISGPILLWVAAEDHSEQTCTSLYRLPESFAICSQILAEAVLLFRTYRLFGDNMALGGGLSALLVAALGFQIYVVAEGMSMTPFLSPPSGPCLATQLHNGNSLLKIFYLVPLAVAFLVTAMTLLRAIQLRWNVTGKGRSPLIKVFVQEGLYYFVFILCANIANCVLYLQSNKNIQTLLVPLSTLAADILACRLILHLRESENDTSGPSHARNAGQATYTHSQRRITALPQTNRAPAPQTKRNRPSLESSDRVGAISQMDFTRSFEEPTATQREVGDDDSEAKYSNVDITDVGRRSNRRSKGVRIEIEQTRFYEASEDERSEKGAGSPLTA